MVLEDRVRKQSLKHHHVGTDTAAMYGPLVITGRVYLLFF